MNRPYWLDFVYIAAWMIPPMLVAFAVSRMAALSGIVGLAAFFGILLVATIVWFLFLVLWTRLIKSETEPSEHNGT
jgi:hypothetical protein